MTALPSHTPRSSGCASPHGQRQRRQSPASAQRPASIAARTAGSSLPSASAVAAVTRRAHSPSAAAAASRAAANCRTGSSPSPAMAASSHPPPAVASAPAAPPTSCERTRTGLRAGLAPALPSPPGCHPAGWHPFAAVRFACGQVTERNGSSARQRSQIRLIETEWQFWPQFAASMLWLLSAHMRCLIAERRAMSLTALVLPTAGGGGGIVAYGFQPGWRVGAGGDGGILSA